MRTLPIALGLVLILGSFLFIPIVAATAVSDGFEAYPVNDKPCLPATTSSPCNGQAYTYTETGTGTAVVDSSIHNGGSKSLLVQSLNNVEFATSGDLCQGTSFAVAMDVWSSTTSIVLTNIPTVGAAPPYSIAYTISFGQGANHNQVSISEAANGGVSTSTGLLTYTAANPTANQFITFTASCPVGAVAGNEQICVSPFVSVPCVQASVTPAATFGGNPYAPPTRIRFQPSGSIIYHLDDLSFFGGTTTLSQTAVTAAFPSGYTLAGFDTDYMQRSVIARLVHAGDFVEQIDSYDPISLQIRGTPAVSNACLANQDGLMATWQDPPGLSYNGFTDCTGTDHTKTNKLIIRDGNLQTPSHANTLCTTSAGSTDFCTFDLTSQSAGPDCPNNGQLSGLSQSIGQVDSMPISWRGGVNQAGKFNEVNIGFAYSTVTSGAIGVWVDSQQNNPGGVFQGDLSCFDEKPFTGTATSADDICNWHNIIDGNDYLTAISGTSNTITWKITLTQHSMPTGNNIYFVPSMSQISQLPSMNGIGCNSFSNDTILKSTSGVINRFRTVGTNIGGPGIWATSITDASSSLRAVTMSKNGLWGAYIQTGNTGWAVFNATSGTILGTGSMPTGTFKDMAISGNGQDLFIATTTQIARYHVSSVTTKVDQPDNCQVLAGACKSFNSDGSSSNGGGTSGTGTSGPIGNFFGLDPGAFDPSGQGNEIRGGFFLSLLLILGFAAVGAGLLPTTKVQGMIFGAGLGALLGFAWTVFLGVMPPIITFILVVIGGSGIGFKQVLKSRKGSDD